MNTSMSGQSSYEELNKEELIVELKQKQRIIQCLRRNQSEGGAEAHYRQKLEEQFEEIQNLVRVFEEINEVIQSIGLKIDSLNLFGQRSRQTTTFKKEKFFKNLQMVGQEDEDLFDSLGNNEGSLELIGKETILSLNALQGEVSNLVEKHKVIVLFQSKLKNNDEQRKEIEEYKAQNKIMKEVIANMQNDYFNLVKEINESRINSPDMELQNMDKEGLMHLNQLLMYSIKELEAEKKQLVRKHSKERHDEKIKYINILNGLKKQKIGSK